LATQRLEVAVLRSPLPYRVAVDLGRLFEPLERGVDVPELCLRARQVVVALPGPRVGLETRVELGLGALLVTLGEARHAGDRPLPAGRPEDLAGFGADSEHGGTGLGRDRAVERAGRAVDERPGRRVVLVAVQCERGPPGDDDVQLLVPIPPRDALRSRAGLPSRRCTR